MKKIAFFSLILILAFTFNSFAGKISYSIDPTTTSPQNAIVIKNSEGETVILFNVPSIEEGDLFTFSIDMKAIGSNIVFPVNAEMKLKANKKNIDVSFEPASITFNDTENSVSSFVTITIPNGNYDTAKKVKIKIKADSENGKGLGNGAGVKVVIVKTSSMQEFLEVIQEELEEILEPDLEIK